MTHLPIPHRIERTRNRSSRAIFRDGTIVIRLAARLNFLEEQRHIHVLLKRMMKVALREHERPKIDPFRTLLQDGAKTLKIDLCTGESIIFSCNDGTKLKAHPRAFGWHIALPPHTSKKTLHQLLWKLVAKHQANTIDAFVRDINDRTLRVPVRKVTLKNMRSRFGSCSRTGNIALATPLLCMKKELLEYVIIHELTHMVHMNHSKSFWRTVEEYCPDYKEKIKVLRKLRLPLT